MNKLGENAGPFSAQFKQDNDKDIKRMQAIVGPPRHSRLTPARH